MKVTSIQPSLALPGGLVQLEFDGDLESDPPRITVGGRPAGIMGISQNRVTFCVPDCESGEVRLNGAKPDKAISLRVGRKIADELHPVTSPAIDAQGNVYTTFSGSRGEKAPFGVFKISADGLKEPFLGDLTNPTGLAVGPDHHLYVSSRHSGTVFRSSFDKQIEKWVDGLGMATGIAFDSKGDLYVGDRSGTIYRVTPDRDASILCSLEPSVSAYHLAFDSEDRLYVSGPTLATQDNIYRIGADGAPHIFFRGFGRPQGLCVMPDGTLLAAASYRGRKGIYRCDGKSAEWFISAPMLVGVAWDPNLQLLSLVDQESLYQISLS